ncbi:hypothetical protein ASPZODRAFT_131155 [Penicilliopsis zonata CBS 506.65]|uniref:Uncharacterized protein n=1 Tax=Penicilliopsis zonata CBS 506.65 TaxID=1073090 RepID=A0A1L9SK71_9EURO|nr:hypothetical protein ASPZODRAFT_131155 [Penicilliopsis zonata CBS 506.65]OJJ47610.1 hypothetical protein ASPZODRAFT_131155 [Penicilliopsis zonata CBS 506.65]
MRVLPDAAAAAVVSACQALVEGQRRRWNRSEGHRELKRQTEERLGIRTEGESDGLRNRTMESDSDRRQKGLEERERERERGKKGSWWLKSPVLVHIITVTGSGETDYRALKEIEWK